MTRDRLRLGVAVVSMVGAAASCSVLESFESYPDASSPASDGSVGSNPGDGGGLGTPVRSSLDASGSGLGSTTGDSSGLGSTSTGGGPSTSSSGPGSNSTIGSTTVVTTSGGGSTGTGTGAGGIPTTVWYASDSDLSAASVLTAYLNTHGYQAQLSPAPVTEPSTYTGNFAVGGSLSGSSGAAWNDAGISWWTYMFHCQIYEGNIVDDTSTSLTCQGNSCGISPYFIGAPVDGPTLVWGVAANDTSAAASAYPGCP